VVIIIEFDGPLVPAAFVAVTVQVYWLASPESAPPFIEIEEEDVVVPDTIYEPEVHVALYAVIGEPPALAGAV
jgi:hypothetical protein